MSDKTILLGTDVAAFVLFHPDDLAHRHADPIAWYSYDFIYRKESAAGRLIVFGTGSDGGWRIRLTTGTLTPLETVRACPSWDFPLIVRHGRILVDNTDALPGEEQMTDPAEITEAWYEIADGAYRVTVHPMALQEDGEEEEEDESDGEDEDGTDALPDYVITFTPVSDIAGIPVAPVPPDLRGFKDWDPARPSGIETGKAYEFQVRDLGGTVFPALPVGEAVAILPGKAARFTVEDDVAEAIFPDDGELIRSLVIAADFKTGALAVLARVTQLSRDGSEKARLGVSGVALVRLSHTGTVRPLQRIAVAPAERPDMGCDAATAAAFHAKLARAAAESGAIRARLDHPFFELERLASLSTAEAATSWALMHLDFRLSDRLAAYAGPVEKRIAIIERHLSGENPPPKAPSLWQRLTGQGR